MKPLVKTVASTAVVLAALAGCASRSSGGSSAAGSGSGTSTSASTSSSADGTTSTQNGSQPSAPGSGTSSGAPSSGQQSASGSAPAGPGQVKITSPQGVTLDKDGVTLVAEVTWGGCDDQPQLVVTSQDASKVVVEVKTTNHARIGVMCPNYARDGSVSVKLAAPLGSRQVIDGVKGAPIPVH